jgi:hypothetical protein
MWFSWIISLQVKIWLWFSNRIKADYQRTLVFFSLKLQEQESSFADGLQVIVVNLNPYLVYANFSNKKKYLASDQHFGAYTELSFPREQKFCGLAR